MTSNAASAARRAPEGDWFKSSYSHPNGNQCVEVFFEAELVHVRDSKDAGAGPVLTVPVEDWAEFLALVASRAPSGLDSTLQFTAQNDGSVSVTASTAPGVTLRFTPGEWSAFVEGVRGAEFVPSPGETRAA